MAYMKHNKLWETEVDKFVSEKVKAQNLIINQVKLQLHDAYQKR